MPILTLRSILQIPIIILGTFKKYTVNNSSIYCVDPHRERIKITLDRLLVVVSVRNVVYVCSLCIFFFYFGSINSPLQIL